MLLNKNATGLRVVRDDAPNVLGKMNESPFEFHLTGSRGWLNPFVAKVGGNTDWDFFVKSTPEVRDFLVSNAFIQEFENPYEDNPNAAEVWKFPSIPSVHVQVVVDITLKLKIENLVRSYLPATFYTLNKDQRKAVYIMVYNTYALGRDDAINHIATGE